MEYILKVVICEKGFDVIYFWEVFFEWFDFWIWKLYYVGIDVGVNYIFKFVKYRGVMWIICRLLVMIDKNNVVKM